jgi:PPOX class probable F420-dependent enzyme
MVCILTAVNSASFEPATEKYVSLATYRRNGVEVKTPVWIAELAGRYYVFSAGDAGKVKRIRATSRVRLAACDVRGQVRSAWIDARARIVSERALIAGARNALRRKYGLVMMLTDLVATLAGRLRRRAYIEIELQPDPRLPGEARPITPTSRPVAAVDRDPPSVNALGCSATAA